MKRLKRFLTRKFDGFNLSIFGFAVLMAILVFYLKTIDKEIAHYDRYRQSVSKMQKNRNELANLLEEPYRFHSYDHINALQRAFEREIASLVSEDIGREFDEGIAMRIEELKQAFERSKRAVEDFKMYNARLTNSLYTLYVLRANIQKAGENTPVVDELFFKLLAIVSNLPFDRTQLTKSMKSLAASKRTNLQKAYYIHMKQFLHDAKAIEKAIRSYRSVHFEEKVRAIDDELFETYIRKRNSQRDIAEWLFLIGFALLYLLWWSYRRVIRTKHTLQAFRSAIENSDNAVMLTDTQRRIVYVNEAFEKISGYRADEIVGKQPNFMKSDETERDVFDDLNETIGRGEKWVGEIVNRRKDGRLLYEKVSIVPLFIDEKLEGYLALKLDITEYKRQLNDLMLAAAVYETLTNAVIITDESKRIVSTNPAVYKLFGYRTETLIMHPYETIETTYEDAKSYPIPWEEIDRKERWSAQVYRKNVAGELLPTWLNIVAVKNEKGKVINYISVDTDLKELFDKQRQIEYLAYHDALTGLGNRTYFEKYVMQWLHLSGNEETLAALLYIDLDRFKTINDTLGHDIGDKILVEAAGRLKRIVGDKAFVTRMGGDEFVVVKRLKYGKKEASLLAKKIIESISQPYRVGQDADFTLSISASIGIVIYPEDSDELSVLMRYADAAMYYAKLKGRSRYSYYSKKLSELTARRWQIEQALHHAIDNGEFSLYFQPQYDLRRATFASMEVLLRWKNESLGFVSPAEFITIAEETGQIVRIGEWVVREGLKRAAKIMARSDIDRIALNISTVQLQQENFVAILKGAVEEAGIGFDRVEIEITERFLMDYHSNESTDVLDEIKALGCHISVDDFGTGYSSLSYLSKLPLDIVKIDKSFIDDLPEESSSTEVVKAIVVLAKSLGYETIAEGVETEAQLRFLEENGCDMIQGYYFAKPMPEDELINFLNNFKEV